MHHYSRKKVPLNFDEVIKDFQACFRDTYSVKTIINKIQRLWQGDHPTLAYVVEACDFLWDEEPLMDQIWGLDNDVNDLLTFHEDDVISEVARCESHVIKQHSKCQQWSCPRSDQTYVSMVLLPSSRTCKSLYLIN